MASEIAMPIELSLRCALMPSGTPTSTKQSDAIANTNRFESSVFVFERSLLTSLRSALFTLPSSRMFFRSAVREAIFARISPKSRSLSFLLYLTSLIASFTT